MTLDLLQVVALVAVGLVAGTLNVVAGGGSLLSLPVMVFLGLPATVANGTNRVAILVQNIGAVWGFRRHGVDGGGRFRGAVVPLVVGAVAGTWLATRVGDASFQRILAGVLVVAALGVLWRPRVRGREERGRAPSPDGRVHATRSRGASTSDAPSLEGSTPEALAPEAPSREGSTPEALAPGAPSREALAPEAPSPRRRLAMTLGWLGAGFYGGFIQAGIGFVLLALATTSGLDLVRGNALKVGLVLAFTPVALVLFAWAGMVDWGAGFALAGGTFVGGQIGVHLSVGRGEVWIRRVVTVMVIVFALRLWWGA